MGWFKNIFIWWSGVPWGTRLLTGRTGVRVGTDAVGNIYYRDRSAKRRWVIYNGEAEASRVPPEWHGWLHHTVDAPPTEQPPQVRAWEKPHRENMTGLAGAYVPPGSLAAGGHRPRTTGDYEAWTPDGA